MKKHPITKNTPVAKRTNQEETSVWQLEILEPRLLLSADMMPGVHELEGVIEQPGERDVYEFVLDKQSRVLFFGLKIAKNNLDFVGP